MSAGTFVNNTGEHSAPYYRLGAENVGVLRRKSKLFYAINVFLSVILIILTFLVLFAVLPRSISSGNTCFWPGPGSRCFWPFSRPNPVMLISMDGFRHDYLEMVRQRFGPNALPNFARFEAGGVRASRSINAFPTVTMPNHQTLITGLYPSSHGIVGNDIRDTKWPNISFSMGDQTSLNNDPWLIGWPEPIWVTLQKAGGLAGSLLWPLTDQLVANNLPFQQVSEFTLLDDRPPTRYPYDKRVKDILWWLDNPLYHLDLVLAYFDEPDETGHAYGPTSLQLAKKVVELDGVLGKLLDGLEQHKLSNKVDIILTADHGMVSISRDRLIPLDQFVNPSDYTSIHLSTFCFVYPEPGKEQEVYNKLKGADEHLQVYWLTDVPESIAFNRPSSRTPTIVLLPDPYWNLVHKMNSSIIAGNHGYPPNFTDVNPFFIANGPSFRVGHTVDKVHAVDVYPLMCSLLHIQSHQNNGSLARIAPLLLKPNIAAHLLTFESWPRWLIWMALEMELLWFILLLAFFFTASVLLIVFVRMNRRYTLLMDQVSDDHDDKYPHV